jgi:hypothetical protein
MIPWMRRVLTMSRRSPTPPPEPEPPTTQAVVLHKVHVRRPDGVEVLVEGAAAFVTEQLAATFELLKPPPA